MIKKSYLKSHRPLAVYVVVVCALEVLALFAG
jgi:hypothetical protein